MSKLKPVTTKYQRSYLYPDQLRTTREDAFWRFHAKYSYWGVIIPQVLFNAWADGERGLKLRQVRHLAEKEVQKSPTIWQAIKPIPKRFMSFYGHIFIKWYPGYRETIKPLKPVTLGLVKEEKTPKKGKRK